MIVFQGTLAPLIIFIGALLLSLFFWGIIRTALWLIPHILFRDLQPLIPASLLGFFLAASWIVPYKGGAFDLRMIRHLWPLIFFVSGVLTAALLYPAAPPFVFMMLGAVVPLILMGVFKLARHPISLVYHFRSRVRLLPLVVVILVLMARLAELNLNPPTE